MKRKRNVPVSKVADLVVTTPLTVQVDSTGEYWLTPDQVRLLKEMRQVAAHLHASNQLLPDPRLVRKSRATSKVRAAAPSNVDSSTVAAFTELTRRSWLPV